MSILKVQLNLVGRPESAAVLEVFDRRLVSMGRRVVHPGGGDCISLDPGEYLVHLRLPWGEVLQRPVSVPADGEAALDLWPEEPVFGGVVRSMALAPGSKAARALDRPELALTWYRVWHQDEQQLTLVEDPQVESRDVPGGLHLELAPPDRGLCFLQVGGPAVPWRLYALPTLDPWTRVEVEVRPAAQGLQRGLALEVSSTNPYHRAFLAFLARGAFDSARALSVELLDQAEQALRGKARDPIAAALGGYVLLRSGELDRLHDWTRNLDRWFPGLPDGPVLHAWHLLRQQGAAARAEVKDRLLDAVRRGIPVYTEGLMLLRDGLLLLKGEEGSGPASGGPRQEDPEVASARAVVRRLAEAADWTGPYTSFYGVDPRAPSARRVTGLPPQLRGVRLLPGPPLPSDPLAVSRAAGLTSLPFALCGGELARRARELGWEQGGALREQAVSLYRAAAEVARGGEEGDAPERYAAEEQALLRPPPRPVARPVVAEPAADEARSPAGEATFEPHDPWPQQGQLDPRMQQAPFDPRMQQAPFDPRMQQAPFDPRVLQAPLDPGPPAPSVRRGSAGDLEDLERQFLDGRLVGFNGVDGSTGRYLGPPLPAAELGRRLLGKELPSSSEDPGASKALGALARRMEFDTFGPPAGMDPADLRQMGWAVVYPEGLDPAVREQVERLVEHRARTVPPDRIKRLEYPAAAGADVRSWLARHNVSLGSVEPTRVPYYVLLVGGPEKIPYAFQGLLDAEYAVGRLCFDAPAQYGQYVQSVMDHEDPGKTRPTCSREVLYWGPRHPGDGSTTLSEAFLIRALHQGAEGPDPGTAGTPVARAAGFASRCLTGPEARVEALHQALHLRGDHLPPALLFTASHGMGFEHGQDDQQRRFQGALLGQEWTGLDTIERTHYLAAEDIGDQARIHGMVAFLFGCYTAGVPGRDSYPMVDHLDTSASTPLVASLPGRLLSHPGGGALAVVGHLDRAWGYSIQPPRVDPQILPFWSCLLTLLSGKPVGHAVRFFNERYALLSTALSRFFDPAAPGEPPSETALARQWLERNDAQNYAVLGDPAVSLRLERLKTV